MLNFNNEELKAKFKTSDDYETFISFVHNLQFSCFLEYNFLGLSDISWDDFFNRSLDKYAKGEIKDFESYIIKAITNHIQKEYKNKRFRIFINLLAKLKKYSHNSNLLLYFIKELSSFGIKINEEYFELLKNEIPTFANLLTENSISTYQEFQDFIIGKYDICIELENTHNTFDANITKVDYFLSLITKYSLVNTNQSKNSSIYQKIKYLIANSNDLTKIHELYCAKFGSVSADLIDATILLFSIDEIIAIFDDLKRYCNTPESNKDNSFLRQISQKMIGNTVASPNNQEETMKQNNYRLTKKIIKDPIIKSPVIENNAKTNNDVIEELVSTQRFLSFFKNYLEISLTRKKEILYEILSKEPKIKLIEFLQYVRKSKEFSENEKNRLQKYKERLQSKYRTIISNILNPPIPKTIYDYFPDYEEITQEHKKVLIDELLNKEPQEKVEKLLKYIKGEFKENPKERKSVYNYLLQNLRRKYKELINKTLNSVSNTIYDYFPNFTKVSKEQKEQLVTALLKKLPISRQINIEAFVNKEECDIARAKKDLSTLKQQNTILIERYILARERNITKDYVLYIAEVVKNALNIDFFPNFNLSKILLLNEAIKLIEYKCRALNNMTKEIFMQYLARKVKEIIFTNTYNDLESIIITTINCMYQELIPQDDILEKN